MAVQERALLDPGNPARPTQLPKLPEKAPPKAQWASGGVGVASMANEEQAASCLHRVTYPLGLLSRHLVAPPGPLRHRRGSGGGLLTAAGGAHVPSQGQAGWHPTNS